MTSDNVRRRDVTETGAIPRAEMEPALHHEPPAPPLPEIIDEGIGSKTGEMPIVTDSGEDSKTRDEDTPKGK